MGPALQRFGALLVVPLAIIVVGCSAAKPTPSLAPTPQPEVTLTIEPTKAPPANPLIPAFGSFPPVPIPDRPANINPLTGLETDPASLQRRPILVRIGNDERVRTSFWQAGMSSADLVFEELIDQLGSQYVNTRMTAVFLSTAPPLVGPVRSGRLINLQIAPMLDGALANSGASDGVRELFAQTPMVNLDEYFSQPAYCYNQLHGYMGRLYTTIPRLREWLVEKGLEKPVALYGFEFSEEAPAGDPATTIGLQNEPWPKWATVEWRYDASSGKYPRYVTGAPHIDNSYPVTAKWGNAADCVSTGSATRAQVTASNVVVLHAKHSPTTIVEDANDSVSVNIDLVGEGQADVFRDGVRVHATWKRDSVQEFFTFVNASGAKVALRPGTTWFEIVPTGYALSLR